MSKPSGHALLLDADYLVFSAMSAAEKETQWEDNVWTLECDHEQAWRNMMSAVDAIVRLRKSFEKSKLVMCFTDTVNWRKDVLPSYKMNRKATRKPTGYYAFVERVMASEEWLSFLRPTLEGDDCMGIISTRPQIVGCTSATIVSPDKDFKTINGEFFHMSAGKFLQIDMAAADEYHMYQTMIGDTTDGYEGIKGVGETLAKEMLAEPFKFVSTEKVLKSGPRKGESVWEWKKFPREDGDSLWDCMVTLAAKYDTTEAELLVQAQVARICRASDFDFENKKVILWTPEK
jgi:DNA polymerase-1